MSNPADGQGTTDTRHLDRLDAALRDLCRALARYLQRRRNGQPDPDPAEPAVTDSLRATADSGAALDLMIAWFSLTPFETAVLVLAAGTKISADAAALCAAAHGDAGRSYLTPSLALAALPDPSRMAFAPGGTLLFWRILTLEETDPGAALEARIVVPDAVLQLLLGHPVLDDRLTGLLEPLAEVELLASELAVAQRMAAALQSRQAPVVHLAMPPGRRALDIVAGIGGALRAQFYHLPGERLPSAADLMAIGRLWQRDRFGVRGALAISLADHQGEGSAVGLVARLAVEADGPVVVIGENLQQLAERCPRPVVRFELSEPPLAEIAQRWRGLLGLTADAAAPELMALVRRFRLPLNTVANCIALARSEAVEAGETRPDGLYSRLRPLLRQQARHGLSTLAQPVPAVAGMSDLVLPAATKEILRQIIAHYRSSARVLEEWGFGRRSGGQGLSVLFAGPSGTGKTMAAEVIARELDLELFRIDLSRIVDKYIGETEKNLARLFDAASTCDAILLFDEADALFGRRSEVRDSHDRYANLEVSYLLQRIESYRGVAVLTSNLPNAVDPAFLRRLNYIVHFTFPDQVQRREIWCRALPPQAPTRDLDLDRLARLSLSGGQIQVLSLNAAMLAADQEEPLSMRHIAVAVRTEFAKQQRPLPLAELADWPA
jgi:hypothetical protein